MANCAVCREDIRPGALCPRCGSDNQGVHDITFGYFASIWAILSFLLIVGPLFMLLPRVLSWMDGILSPIASVRVAAPISLLLTLVIAFFLFSMRDDLHIYSLTRTFRKKVGRSLPIIALWFFVVAVLLTFVLGFAITSKDLIIGSRPGQVRPDGIGRFFIAFLMTGCLIMVFSFFALASGLMAVHEFGVYADEHTPDPIYLNEQLMLDVVLRAVKEQIGDEDPLSLSEMRRTPGAGLTLLLREKGSLDTEKGELLLEEKEWLVEADLWARLRQVVEHNRAVKVEKPKS